LQSKNILVAPLNWGIGHATRCIPIINQLLLKGYNPIIASDGEALYILQKEFPSLKSIEFPSYDIKYPKNGKYLKIKLLLNIPKISRAIKKEKRLVSVLVDSEELIGIISDNRLGVRNAKIPSVYMTHQLNVLTGIMSGLSSYIHRYFINKFDKCWVPDDEFKNYSGVLSKTKKVKNQQFIGVLSRFEKVQTDMKYDLLVLLSGLEPLRSQLENKLILELKKYKGKVLFVRGKISREQKIKVEGAITFYNYMLTTELQKAINESKLILARSGYSTIMDLVKLDKKAFFIPTTGQNEQEYLAKRLHEMKVATFSSEDKFKIEMLSKTENYTGFSSDSSSELMSNLFDLFHCK